jgi:hypothetical protein|nr:MAG TPA: hypothetical protein [Caudoviricetes sp.]
MKNLEITIGKRNRMWALDLKCDYSHEAREVIMKMFGCCHVDGDVLSSGVLASSPFTLVGMQAELLSNAE